MLKSRIASNPMTTHTPIKEIATPRPFLRDRRSSLKSIAAKTKVKIAVLPLSIEARPLSIWVCPHAIIENGMILFSMPMTNSEPHSFRFGRGNFSANIITQSIKLAHKTRFATIVKMGTSLIINEYAKKLPPQIIARIDKVIHADRKSVCCFIIVLSDNLPDPVQIALKLWHEDIVVNYGH